MTEVYVASNLLAEISVLAGLTRLNRLDVGRNSISDLTPLIENAERGGLGPGDEVWLGGNPLSSYSQVNQIPRLRDEFHVTVHWP